MTTQITSDNIATSTLNSLGGGVKITTVAYPGSVTAANPAGGETITVTGSGFNVGIIAYINNTIPCTTTYINSTSLTFVAPATGVGTYNIVLYNTDGSSGVKPIGIIFSLLPTWVTASGALLSASTNVSYSQSVSATGDGTIIYSLTSGSLPSGLSLNSSTGAITGTTPNTTGTSTFTITASDSQNQTASRNFSITLTSLPTTVEYLVVAGGGGGGRRAGGGGGAGGLLAGSVNITLDTLYTITVGGSGAGSTSDFSAGSSGLSSNISYGSGTVLLTTVGGGGGGSALGGTGQAGGSGGGGNDGEATTAAGGTGTAGPPRQGYAGGSGALAPSYSGGGGGGAGSVGGNAPSGSGGTGGDGASSSISGSAVYYAGGGGGGSAYGTGGTASAVGGSGAAGGGGATVPSNATANFGGGGGGGGYSGGGISGSNGGSGVVFLRYADSFLAATSTTGSPTITVAGGYRVYKFTGSGSITF